jgi:hypothetical protein
MLKLSLLPFRIIDFYTTEYNTLEFHVVMQQSRAMLSECEEKQAELEKIINLIRYESIYSRTQDIISSKQELLSTQQTLMATQQTLAMTQKTLSSIKNSIFWHMTKPLRLIGKFAKNFKSKR